MHLTETCEVDAPRIITHVETTSASTPDGQSLTPIHEDLKAIDLLPSDHLVDTGYVDAELLLTSQDEYHVNLVGPTMHDTGWQARQPNPSFTSKDFQIDWARQQATCPAGKTSQFWTPATDTRGNPIIQIKFAKRECRACLLQPQCTHANPPRRTITVRPEAQHKALLVAREREQTPAFIQQYARRAGIEGTLSYGVRMFDLRRARYLGLAKTHLQHLLMAAAMNLIRVVRWLAGVPVAQARPSAFARLYPIAAT